MMKQYPGLPLQSGASESIWLHSVKGNPLLDYTSGDLPDRADVVIIGSGITGATIAHTLLTHPTPPKSVVMLEARQLCSGATGRNAGHCRPDIHRGFSKYEALFGAEQAVKILHNEQATFEAAIGYIRDHDVDCELWVGQTLDVYTLAGSQAACETNNEAFTAAGGNMSRVRVLQDPVEAEKVSGVKGAKYVEATHAATLHPWKLVAHVIQSCINKGLKLYTHTPVTAVERDDESQGWSVVTENGRISTPTVIHATNGYARALLPELYSSITPQPHLVESPGLPEPLSHSMAIQQAPALYSVNPRPDGSILFGARGHGYDKYVAHLAKDLVLNSTNDAVEFPEYRRELLRFSAKHLGITQERDSEQPNTWTGVQGRSADLVPWIGQFPGKPGQWMCCGHHGHGMARIFTCGPALAQMVLGSTWSETGLPECFEVTAERIQRHAPVLARL